MMIMSISVPVAGEYVPYQYEYIRRVPTGDVLGFLDRQLDDALPLLRGLDEATVMRRPAPGEWTIKEIIGHMADSERIFTYRALCFARGDQAHFPGFEQDEYVATANFNARTLTDLCDELAAIRQATLCLYRSFSPAAILRQGIASENPSRVRTWIYITGGHVDHHMESIRRDYLGLGQ
jgi:hypothetical protein